MSNRLETVPTPSSHISARQRIEGASNAIDHNCGGTQYWIDLAGSAGIQGEYQRREFARELRELAIQVHMGKDIDVPKVLQGSFKLDDATAQDLARKIYAATVPDTPPIGIGF